MLNLNAGIRQGGKSSPTFWNLFINGLSDLLENECGNTRFELEENFLPFVSILMLLYADDIVLIGTSATDLQRKIQLTVQHSKKWGYTFSAHKCKVLVINNPFNDSQNFTLGSTELEVVDQYKYLGMLITASGIDFSNFVEQRRDAALTRCSMLKTLLEQLPFATIGDAIDLYKALVRPLLETGAQVIHYNKKDRTIIEKTQLECIQMLTGLFSSTLRESQRLIAGCEPMEKRIDTLKLNFFAKISKLGKNLLVRQVFDTCWKATEIACGIYEERNLKNFSVCIEYRNLLRTYRLGNFWIPENIVSTKYFRKTVQKTLCRVFIAKENQSLIEHSQSIFLIQFTGLHRKFFSKSIFRKFTFKDTNLKWFLRFISGNIPFRWKVLDKNSNLMKYKHEKCYLCNYKWTDFENIFHHILQCDKIDCEKFTFIDKNDFKLFCTKRRSIEVGKRIVNYIQKSKIQGFCF